MKKLLLGLVLIGTIAGGLRAQEVWPVDVGLIDWIYRPTDVVGLRLGIPYGQNDSITGIDIGLLGRSDYAWAFQVNLLENKVRDVMGGVQVSLINEAGQLTGLQVGLWNRAPTASGFQVGLINLSDEMDGLQVGLVNRTEILHGYQIGLINVIRESPVPFCVLINFYY